MNTKRDSSADQEFTGKKLQQCAARIQYLRRQKGYESYEHFAIRHGINRVQFGRYEKGQDLRFSSLVRIVIAFDMTLAEFFSEGFDD